MKVKAKTKELNGALAKLATLPGRDSGPAGNSVVTIDADEFGGLRLCRTTVQALARIICEGDIEEPGRAVAPYLPLFNALRACEDEEVELTLAPNELVIRSGTGEGFVSLWKDEEVIPMPPRLEGVELTLSHEELMSTLRIAGAAASTDRSRPQLMGICFRKVPGALSVIGCNGHRAHVCRLAALVDRIDPEPNGERDYGILLPTEGVECAKKIFVDEKSDCVLTLGPSGVQLDAGEISLRLPVSGDRVPFMDSLLNPVPVVRFAVDREGILKAVKAISPSSPDGTISLTVDRGTLKVSAASAAARVGRTTPCESDGTGEYKVLAQYMTQLLECSQLERLHLWIVADGQQIYYREGERDFLVMFRQLGNPAPLTKQKK